MKSGEQNNTHFYVRMENQKLCVHILRVCVCVCVCVDNDPLFRWKNLTTSTLHMQWCVHDGCGVNDFPIFNQKFCPFFQKIWKRTRELWKSWKFQHRQYFFENRNGEGTQSKLGLSGHFYILIMSDSCDSLWMLFRVRTKIFFFQSKT